MSYENLWNIESPQNKRYREDKENKVNEMMTEYKDQIEIISIYLTNILLKKVNTEEIKVNSELQEISQELQESFKEIKSTLENQDSIISTSKIENVCLCRAIGRKIAEKADNKFDIWGDILSLIDEQYLIYKSWVEHISTDAIRKNKEEINKISEHNHPLELVRTWGYFRDRSYWDSFDENNRINKEKSKDSWEYVESSIKYGSEFRLNSELKFKSDLLQKLGLKEWILWVKDLPLIQIKYIVILDIKSINDVQGLIGVIIELEDIKNFEKEELLCLVIHHTIDLLNKVDNNLNHYSNARWTYSDEEKSFSEDFKQKLGVWNNDYLSNYISKLVDGILNNKDMAGKNVLNYMLRHIEVRSERDKVIDEFRTEIIKSIIRNKLDIKDIIQNISKEHFNSKTILNSLLLLFSSEDIADEYEKFIFKKMWDEYYTLLNSKIYWGVPLNSDYDYHKLIWLMAGVLSKLDSPKFKLKELLDAKYVSSEGWNYSIEDHYSSVSNTAHILTVGCMAIEWLGSSKAGKEKDSIELFDFVWEYTHRWVRSLSYQPDEINELLVQLWARLCLVYDYEMKSRVIETLENMDSLEHILISSKVFLSNINRFNPDIERDEDIKVLVNNKFNMLLPIIKRLYSVDESKIEWYTSLKDDVIS